MLLLRLLDSADFRIARSNMGYLTRLIHRLSGFEIVYQTLGASFRSLDPENSGTGLYSASCLDASSLMSHALNRLVRLAMVSTLSMIGYRHVSTAMPSASGEEKTGPGPEKCSGKMACESAQCQVCFALVRLLEGGRPCLRVHLHL